MRKNSGFTLIELMVSIAVLAVLLGVGVPALIDFMETNRRAAAINTLITDIQQARNTATSTGAEVTLCTSSTGSTCTAPFAPDWAKGWMAFSDLDADGMLDAGEPVLSVGNAREGVRMPSNASSLRFRPGYRLMVGFGASIAVCVGDDPNDYRWIVLSPAGRPRLDNENSDVSC